MADPQREIRRKFFRTFDGTTTSLSASGNNPWLDMSTWAGGGYVITATTSTPTQFKFYGAAASQNSTGGSDAYVASGSTGQIFDSNNSAVTQAISVNQAYALPDQCFPFPFVQLQTDAGTACVQFVKKS